MQNAMGAGNLVALRHRMCDGVDAPTDSLHYLAASLKPLCLVRQRTVLWDDQMLQNSLLTHAPGKI